MIRARDGKAMQLLSYRIDLLCFALFPIVRCHTALFGRAIALKETAYD